MKFIPVWFAITVLPLAANERGLPAPAMPTAPAAPAAPAKGDKEGGKFVFSLAPKAFQKEPLLDFNVLTEMTNEGRLRVRPTAEAPEYCLIQGGAMKEGGDLRAAMKPPSAEAVRLLVVRALERQHYREASEGGPTPALVVLYHWGVHESPAFVDLRENPDEGPPSDGFAEELMPRVLGDITRRKILIDRAALVGGMKFAVALNAAMNEEAAYRRANDAGTRSAEAVGMSGMDVGGMLSPFHRFIERDAQTRRLVEESFGGLYFVIISAFDSASVAAGKPVLLWRTKMSVNSSSVSLVETIQPMIVAGREFIGRETDGGILISRKISRTGTVKVGEAQVEEYLEEGKTAAEKKAMTAEPAKR